MAERAEIRLTWGTRLSVAVAVSGCIFLAIAVSVLMPSDGWGYDFAAYYQAALRLAETGSPYQAETVAAPYRPGPFGLYLYAPQLATALLPLTALPFDQATFVWLAVRLIILAAMCALLPVSPQVRLAAMGTACLSPFILHDINLGNVSLLVTAGTVLVWRWLDGPRASVALASLLTLRPTAAIVLVWWLLRGKVRPVIWTVATLGLLCIAVLPFVQPRVFREYAAVLLNVTQVTGVPYNVDIASSLLQLGANATVAQLGLYAGYFLAGAAILFSLRRDRETSFIVTVGASLLLSPLLWGHYLTHIIVTGAFLASRGLWLGLALPVLGWVHTVVGNETVPLMAVAMTLLPFMAPASARVPLDQPTRVPGP